ncbi:hypothetical protein A2U01_0060873, partial [Trifolium medium]|nr:hypothetical protein [Trifolium medium]
SDLYGNGYRDKYLLVWRPALTWRCDRISDHLLGSLMSSMGEMSTVGQLLKRVRA